MPPYWRNYYGYYRRPWFRRRRARKTFRRRHRRRYRVRKLYNKKLPRIILRQWQPACIRKCSIKGTACLAYINCARLPHNSTMYEESITPEHWPGGGCFSVCQFSLDTLYALHQKCRNWWTNSNVDLPLCRYNGCKVRFYQCEQTDYVVKCNINLPSPSNKLTYPSCHPKMLLMNTHRIVVPSKQNKKLRRPYITKWFRPPQQLETKWYFQVDFYKTPLIQFYTAATNLNYTYIRPQSNSTTITFMSINTTLIQNRNMSTQTNLSWPFKRLGTRYEYMYIYVGANMPEKTEDIPIADLIPLTNIKQNKAGDSYNELYHTPSKESFKTFIQAWPNYWGNIFNHHHQEHKENFLYAFVSPETLKNNILTKDKDHTVKWKDVSGQTENISFVLTKLTEDIYIPFQYNPNKDTGQDTLCYLLPNATGDGWDPPSSPELILSGFPMWLILWGFVDFQTKLKKVTNINTQQILVIKSHFTQRPTDMLIVPISKSFIEGKSPYEQQCLPTDFNMWYPMEQYQEECINEIVSTGPAIPYLNDSISDNICIGYNFKFKWGGCPPKNINIENPINQPQYPVPSNEHETNSLQSPAQALETTLYSFDYRHGQFTTTALDRITKDWRSQPFISSITDTEKRQQLQQVLNELQTTEEEEQQKEAQIRNQLQQLKQQQQSLRQRIIQLMNIQSQ
nr:MAG: ORF1 [TTV-like mini virus]UGV34628.1 MAG: ORF1 [TTV-like mini virus]